MSASADNVDNRTQVAATVPMRIAGCRHLWNRSREYHLDGHKSQSPRAS